MSTFTQEERKAILASIPWVRRLEKPKPCDAHRNDMPGKAYRGIVSKDPWKCKKLAHWRFTAKRNSWSATGNYCWPHLFSRGLYGDMLESERFEAWLEGKGLS